ncbi:helix-turn-helix transcriptional regulator [Bdellovibrionota bacterium FG-2]
MRIEGHMWKDGKFWIVEIPALDLMTQGLSKTEAYRVAGTVVEDVVGKEGFKVTVGKAGKTAGKDSFVLEANDSSEMISLMLRRQRVKKGISVREASALMGSSSPNAWGAYEQGKRLPTLDQLERMIQALNKRSQLVLRIDSEESAA